MKEHISIKLVLACTLSTQRVMGIRCAARSSTRNQEMDTKQYHPLLLERI
jgi:hypothetical protein